MTDEQKSEVLSGVEDAVREFNERGREAGAQTPAEASSHLTEPERASVKAALLDLIEECRKGGSTIDELASDRLLAVSEAAKVLLML